MTKYLITVEEITDIEGESRPFHPKRVYSEIYCQEIDSENNPVKEIIKVVNGLEEKAMG